MAGFVSVGQAYVPERGYKFYTATWEKNIMDRRRGESQQQEGSWQQQDPINRRRHASNIKIKRNSRAPYKAGIRNSRKANRAGTPTAAGVLGRKDVSCRDTRIEQT
jgi:hypothetical protein